MERKAPLGLLLAAFALAGCGRAPVPVDESPAHTADDGHDHGPAPPARPSGGGEMPRDAIHAPFAAHDAGAGVQVPNPHVGRAEGGETFAGVVRLPGEHALRTEGYLFVSVVPAGTSAPACFDRFMLADPQTSRLVEGERIVPFLYAGCSAPPGDLELKVQLDVDGFVETKEEGVLVGRFAIGRGDESIDVTLEE